MPDLKTIYDLTNRSVSDILGSYGVGIGDALFSDTYLETSSVSALSKTCVSFFDITRSELTERAAKTTMQNIVYGEQEQAEAMIKANPRLLLVKSQAKDYSGRTIIATPFQAALGAEDVRMWEMMMPYFEELERLGAIKSAVGEMKRQFDLQFPDGLDWGTPFEFEAIYNKLATAIIEDDDNGEKAIQAFRLEMIENNVVESGYHFNMRHLLAACIYYKQNYDRLRSSNKQNAFSQKVLGYVQRQMPSNYAQMYCSGLKNVVRKKGDFKRTLNLFGGSQLFPLSVDGTGLGFDVSVVSVFSAQLSDIMPPYHDWCGYSSLLLIYSAKRSALYWLGKGLDSAIKKAEQTAIQEPVKSEPPSINPEPEVLDKPITREPVKSSIKEPEKRRHRCIIM